MATAAQHLPTVGVTLQEAHDFIFSHIDQPSIIYNAAIDHGVTIAMLNEITGYSTNDISEYFKSSELIPEKLNDISPFINSDLGIFAHFVNFNNNSGILSTASLHEKVKPLIKNPDYDDAHFFGPLWSSQLFDGVYTPDELGVAHLGNVSATLEDFSNFESLFYGTILNIFKALDQTELDQINSSSPNDIKAVLVDALSDTSPLSVWTDQVLSDHVVTYAANLIDIYMDDLNIYGVLDASYLGLAVT